MSSRPPIAVAVLLALAACRPPPPFQPSDLAGSRDWTSPARPAADGSVRFLILGDWGFGDAHQFEVAASLPELVRVHGLTFALTLGDNFYPAGVSSVDDPLWRERFERPYGALGLPFMATLGNHDWRGNGRAQWRYRHPAWQLPAPYYEFEVGPVRFIALDTTRWDVRQARWLDARLERPHAGWTIVYGHHPALSSLRPTPAFWPHLAGRADFYLAGHDHNKQLIARDKRPVQVVCGAGGAPLYGVRRVAGTLFARSTHGVAAMIIAGQTAIVRFFDAHGTMEHEHVFGHRSARPARDQSHLLGRSPRAGPARGLVRASGPGSGPASAACR